MQLRESTQHSMTAAIHFEHVEKVPVNLWIVFIFSSRQQHVERSLIPSFQLNTETP